MPPLRTVKHFLEPRPKLGNLSLHLAHKRRKCGHLINQQEPQLVLAAFFRPAHSEVVIPGTVARKKHRLVYYEVFPRQHLYRYKRECRTPATSTR